ncbi:MAG TPA: metal-dependent hydrolase [Noviherbaspirillum sp.]|uniref:metal-dependent hydrolase n=1 Tax=Noviherbaspirillum sp. TaxID=1926288 RepID=UPI002D34A281|nr:metal-dependent hydrolase [Noviherbaspirillum sp.]HYD94165.1 metal-dependent hydrolase [Noviherbaspirillum sp.]
MDNLSHSVAGLALGECIHRSLPPEADTASERVRHRLLLFAAWAASNFPDLDLVLTPLLPAPLGYLLHHRGHTHTFLYAIPQALLLWALVMLCWPAARRLTRRSRHARHGFIAAIGAGLVLHLLMDFLNSYGIHPFHPFDSQWLYGDLVFILEPVFWVAFGVPLALTAPGRALRAALLVLLAGVPLFFTLRGFLSWGSFAFLMLCGATGALAARRAAPRSVRALAAAFLIGIGFVLVQAAASREARRVVTETLQREAPAERVLDVSMTAFPANPLCWNFVAIASDEAGGSYALRGGTVSALPALFAVGACPPGLSAAGRGDRRAVAPLFERRGDLHMLRALKEGNCHVEAWLRFARMPWVNDETATDLRYGMTGNFSTLRLADFRQRECAQGVPGWDFPRADLLAPPAPRSGPSRGQ